MLVDVKMILTSCRLVFAAAVMALLLSACIGDYQQYGTKKTEDNETAELLSDISAEFDKLRPQSIRPAEGFIKYDYLIPAGFYKQMWDWDGFFIGCHLASRSTEEARYLKWWVLNTF